jgi:DNA-directed RNA polymerase specialized sigma24 family protein
MIDAVVTKNFELFVTEVEPRLRRALAGHLPLPLIPDAVAEAFAYAWKHWDRVQQLDCPSSYLFRVAQSSSRSRLVGVLPGPDPARLPEIEPRLGDAMKSLSSQQRSVVWLVHGCGWTYSEAAEALHISASAVGTHLTRGMSRLRAYLGVTEHG